MTTLTLTLDDEAVARAQQAACRQRQSLEEMVRNYVIRLGSFSGQDAASNPRDALVKRLEQTFADLSRPLHGKGNSNRDELYER